MKLSFRPESRSRLAGKNKYIQPFSIRDGVEKSIATRCLDFARHDILSYALLFEFSIVICNTTENL